jgi:hypothetical protein
MLAHLRKRVEAALADTHEVTLSTYGPANLQVAELPCEARGLRLYVWTPSSSDHLFNLETNPEVVVTTTHWQLRGHARALLGQAALAGLALTQGRSEQWGTLLEVRPTQIQLGRWADANYGETIDIDE